MGSFVKNVSVVILSEEKIGPAIALFYSPNKEDDAPVPICRAREKAKKISLLVKKLKLAKIEYIFNSKLANKLLVCEEGECIPDSSYKEVAKVLMNLKIFDKEKKEVNKKGEKKENYIEQLDSPVLFYYLKRKLNLTEIEIQLLAFLYNLNVRYSFRKENDKLSKYCLKEDVLLKKIEGLKKENLPLIIEKFKKYNLLINCPDKYIITEDFDYFVDNFNTLIAEQKISNKAEAEYKWEDFDYIKDKDIFLEKIKNAIKQKNNNIRILIYGDIGLGKKEFAKVLAKKLSFNLFKEENNDWKKMLSISEAKNKIAFLDNGHNLVGINERILPNVKCPIIQTIDRQSFKIVFNSDNIPLQRVDMFSHVLKVSNPKYEDYKNIWIRELKKVGLFLTNEQIEILSNQTYLNLNIINNVVQNAKNKNFEKFRKITKGNFDKILSDLESQIKCTYGQSINLKKKRKIDYNLSLVNSDTDLFNLKNRICTTGLKNFSICLYGPSGTGKSAYAEWLADQMKIPVIKVLPSDIFDQYYGESERKIKEIFNKAKETHSMLLFDEIDSFLYSKDNLSEASWLMGQINEFITQMENIEYPVVGTSNYFNKLDCAVYRRFDFKIKMDAMTSIQRTKAFENFFGFLNVNLSSFEGLTPGDFTVVYKKAEVLGYLNNKEILLKMLEEELSNKGIKTKIGF